MIFLSELTVILIAIASYIQRVQKICGHMAPLHLWLRLNLGAVVHAFLGFDAVTASLWAEQDYQLQK